MPQHHVGFSGTMIVHNIESEALTLSEMAWTAASDDPEANPLAPKFTAMRTPIAIRANSSTGLGVYIPISGLQEMSQSWPSVRSIIVFYKGNTADRAKTPVRFHMAFGYLSRTLARQRFLSGRVSGRGMSMSP